MNTKLPHGFAYVVSRKQLRQAITPYKDRIIEVHFAGISSSEAKTKAWWRHRNDTRFHTGMVDAFPVKGKWMFSVHIEALRSESIQEDAKAIAEMTTQDIDAWIKPMLELRAPARVNRELYLGFSRRGADGKLESTSFTPKER